MIAHDVHPIKLVFLPVLCHRAMGSLLHYQDEGQLGRPVYGETYPTVAFTQVSSEDKGALAKLMEAIWTNYDRFDEIHHHWGGNILGPKMMAHIAKREKAKATELATQLG